MKRSFIKIYGPPVLKAIRALEKMAIDMPEVCIMNPVLKEGLEAYSSSGIYGPSQGVQQYFTNVGGPDSITVERCNKIVSKSGEILGEYDFFFEWFKQPEQKDIENLIGKIDETLAPLGVRYTITTKE